MNKLLTLATLLLVATTANADSAQSTAFKNINLAKVTWHIDNSATPQMTASSAGSLYELLFNYSSHANQFAHVDNNSTSENNSQSAETTAAAGVNDEVAAEQLFVTNAGIDILQFATIDTSENLSSNVNYVKVNPVPIPAAAWLFISALALFSLARRSSI